MSERELSGSASILLLCIFVLMVGVFVGIGGLIAGWVFAKPILIASAIGMVAVFWLADAFKSFDRFSFRKRKQD
ncbi:hypothetical protein [Agrobacterium rosae]|uniref:hypothetical protein n=1 Tax=Agrobacterium rosae TaxID=1972867 RepID=UPI003BA2ED78